MKTGKLAESVLQRSVLKQLHQGKSASVGADCAFFTPGNDQVLAWCVQEAAVAVQAGRGELTRLFVKAANNLAAAGAVPVSAQLALMLPVECEETAVKMLMEQAVMACGELKMELAGGDTNVSRAVSMPIASVTAIGTVKQGERHDLSLAKAGQDLVLSKWIGLEGTAILAETYNKVLSERYPAYLVEEAAGFDKMLSVIPEAKIACANGACALHDLSQGGVFGALWELAEGSGLGLTADLKKIPIRQETVEVCEVCGVNPYEMRSGGSLLMTAQDGMALVEALEKEGIPAAVIGKLTDSRDRMIVHGEEIRYLDRPRGEDSISILADTCDLAK